MLELIRTAIANLTADGRDSSTDYKRCCMGLIRNLNVNSRPPRRQSLLVVIQGHGKLRTGQLAQGHEGTLQGSHELASTLLMRKATVGNLFSSKPDEIDNDRMRHQMIMLDSISRRITIPAQSAVSSNHLSPNGD